MQQVFMIQALYSVEGHVIASNVIYAYHDLDKAEEAAIALQKQSGSSADHCKAEYKVLTFDVL